MTTTKRSTTLNRGAADEREAIKDHLRRLRKIYRKADPDLPTYGQDLVEDLLLWIQDRAKRTRAKTGGIGPKTKRS